MKLENLREWLGWLATLMGVCAVSAAAWLTIFQINSSYVDWEFEEKLRLLFIVFAGAAVGWASLSFVTLFKQCFKNGGRAARPAWVGLLLVGCACLTYFLAPSPRTHPRGAAMNVCIANLRLIDGAKQVWALEHQTAPNVVPTEEDLTSESQWKSTKPYFKKLPHCPLHGVYNIGAISNAPTCSIPEHRLP